ncbi:uncharacterized protein [Ptychodera flava]|uniref:uncharacterized protein isoform X2 n=1 Tax=Ptychodera flava TaxID=63121 RepID=UPI00396A6A62
MTTGVHRLRQHPFSHSAVQTKTQGSNLHGNRNTAMTTNTLYHNNHVLATQAMSAPAIGHVLMSSPALTSGRGNNGTMTVHNRPHQPDALEVEVPSQMQELLTTDLITSRKKRQFTPDEKKDMSYWSKRRKNNEAAKRSREKRRLNDIMLETKILALSEENTKLKNEIRELKRRFGVLDSNCSSDVRSSGLAGGNRSAGKKAESSHKIVNESDGQSGNERERKDGSFENGAPTSFIDGKKDENRVIKDLKLQQPLTQTKMSGSLVQDGDASDNSVRDHRSISPTSTASSLCHKQNSYNSRLPYKLRLKQKGDGELKQSYDMTHITPMQIHPVAINAVGGDVAPATTTGQPPVASGCSQSRLSETNLAKHNEFYKNAVSTNAEDALLRAGLFTAHANAAQPVKTITNDQSSASPQIQLTANACQPIIFQVGASERQAKVSHIAEAPTECYNTINSKNVIVSPLTPGLDIESLRVARSRYIEYENSQLRGVLQALSTEVLSLKEIVKGKLV